MILPDTNEQGFMMISGKDNFPRDAYSVVETLQPSLESDERLIRVVLMTGFIVVLAIEIWLLLQALQLW